MLTCVHKYSTHTCTHTHAHTHMHTYAQLHSYLQSSTPIPLTYSSLSPHTLLPFSPHTLLPFSPHTLLPFLLHKVVSVVGVHSYCELCTPQWYESHNCFTLVTIVTGSFTHVLGLTSEERVWWHSQFIACLMQSWELITNLCTKKVLCHRAENFQCCTVLQPSTS